jgi:methylated-DNA-[protein]-cysteine S-methyltransferase
MNRPAYALRLPSPLGPLLLTATETAVSGLYLPDHHGAPPLPGRVRPGSGHPVLAQARRELDEYFAGRRLRFEVPLALSGTGFQQAVWSALTEIPFGTTTSYIALAARIGRPRAVRAVGAANARNPVSILVPCHRVIGADGALRGYAGGEARKRWLLDHERAILGGAPDLYLR